MTLMLDRATEPQPDLTMIPNLQLYQVHQLDLAEGSLSFDGWNAVLVAMNDNTASLVVSRAFDPILGPVNVLSFCKESGQAIKLDKKAFSTLSPFRIEYSIHVFMGDRVESERFTHDFRGGVSLSTNWMLSSRLSTGLFRSYELASIVRAKGISADVNGTQFVS